MVKVPQLVCQHLENISRDVTRTLNPALSAALTLLELRLKDGL
jgi:hypothetical protein